MGCFLRSKIESDGLGDNASDSATFCGNRLGMADALAFGAGARGAAMAVKVQLDHVGMAFTTPGGAFRAFAPPELAIETGRFVGLVGPSRLQDRVAQPRGTLRRAS